jgi:pimeloyl-ACP methyl ester carboxylesterase
MARRWCVEDGGEIRFDYDMRIADNFKRRLDKDGDGPDLWPVWKALDGRPVTLLHGELSDLLTAETAARMVAELPGAELVTIPATGHAPSLEEPESIAALDRLLDRVLKAHQPVA